jgi:hypothetical protein
MTDHFKFYYSSPVITFNKRKYWLLRSVAQGKTIFLIILTVQEYCTSNVQKNCGLEVGKHDLKIMVFWDVTLH